jgi:glycosyltransferase involved in cell wall biosynthesis
MAALRVGIDAHSIGSGQSGNETYYRTLLQGLDRVDGAHEYVVYGTNHSALLDLRLDRKRFRIYQVKPATPYARIPFAMPWKANHDRLDVFHAQFIVPPFLKCRTVTTIPDIAFEHYPEFFPAYHVAWSRRLVPWSARRADHVITVSQYSKSDLVNLYNVDPEKITVTYEAAEEDYYPRDRERAREYIAERYRLERPFVLYVGRIQARKNLIRLVEAFRQVRRAGFEYDLVLVGKSEWNNEPVAARIVELGLSRNVVITGYVPQEDLPWFYNAADVFAYPSFFEGFGLPVMEAMACGTPVITSAGSSLEEIAGGAALIVDPRDLNSIKVALERLLGDKTLRRDLGHAGIGRSSKFEPNRTALETLSVYRHVAGLDRVTASPTLV